MPERANTYAIRYLVRGWRSWLESAAGKTKMTHAGDMGRGFVGRLMMGRPSGLQGRLPAR